METQKEQDKEKTIFDGLENFKILYNYLLYFNNTSSSPSPSPSPSPSTPLTSLSPSQSPSAPSPQSPSPSPSSPPLSSASYFTVPDKHKAHHLQSSIDFTSLDIKLDLSIDFIKIFYVHSNTTALQYMSLLKNNFDKVTRNNNTKRIIQAEVTIQNITYKIFFSFISVNNFFIGVSIRLVHPDSNIINHVKNVFGNSYILTSVEYSADLRSNDNEKLLRIISCTMIQKHARSAVNKIYSTTFYSSNPRKAFSLGSYVYKKSFENDEAIRIECRCKRNFFKKQRISTMEDAFQICSNKVFEKIDFKLFNLKRFLRKHLSLDPDSYLDDLKTARLFEADFFDHFSKKYGGGLLSVMTLLKNMGVKYQHIYFDRYPFSAYFLSLLRGKTFG